MNDLAVSISVSYFPRNMMRKRLFSLITKSSLVSVKSSFKRVISSRKGIYDALGNVWLIKDRDHEKQVLVPFLSNQIPLLCHQGKDEGIARQDGTKPFKRFMAHRGGPFRYDIHLFLRERAHLLHREEEGIRIQEREDSFGSHL